jgi:hypothetical protein
VYYNHINNANGVNEMKVSQCRTPANLTVWMLKPSKNEYEFVCLANNKENINKGKKYFSDNYPGVIFKTSKTKPLKLN